MTAERLQTELPMHDDNYILWTCSEEVFSARSASRLYMAKPGSYIFSTEEKYPHFRLSHVHIQKQEHNSFFLHISNDHQRLDYERLENLYIFSK